MLITCTKENHFNWGDNCEGWHLAKSNALSVIKETMHPHTKEKKHYHQYSQQMFYILEGQAKFYIEDKVITAKEHEAVQINAKEVHYIENSFNKNLIFLVISTPSTTEDRIEV